MKRIRGAVVAIALLTFVGAALPSITHAATVDVRTAQVLPPGGASCSSLPVQNIVPYVINGELQSFDVVIADPSYVAVQAQVGNTLVPFNYMSRWNQGDGTLRIHVDVDNTPIYGSVPVTVILLSSPTGRPTCLSTISFGILGNAGSAPNTSQGSGTIPTNPATSSSTGDATSSDTATGPSSSTASVTVPVSSVGSSVMQHNLERACSASGALQLWFVLLALFVVMVTIVAIAQPPLAEKSPAIPFAAILIPLVLLIAFWYMAPLCRAASWIPVILIIAAILGLLVAFRDRGEVAQVIQLPPAKK